MVLGTIATGIGAWNAFKKTKLGSGISKKVGNCIQNKTRAKDDDSYVTKFLKGAGNVLNEALFDPTHPTFVAETARDKSDPSQQISRNSPNAVTHGADGSMYNEPTAQKKHYDYIRNDFENLLRKKLPPEIGRSHKYNPQEYLAKTLTKIEAQKQQPGLMKRFRRFVGW